MNRAFLTAQWRYLAMLNYAIDPALLQPLLPPGTELDSFDNTTYLSMVGFRFLRTKVFGLGIPWHRDFEEVNLRFYVRRRVADGWRRGVAFVGELVPRRAIAWVARTLYGEPYAALPMGHCIEHTAASIHVEYRWQRGGKWESLGVLGRGAAATLGGRFPRGVHRRALLGLYGPARRRAPCSASTRSSIPLGGSGPARRATCTPTSWPFTVSCLSRPFPPGPFRPSLPTARRSRCGASRRLADIIKACRGSDSRLFRR